MSPKSFAVLLAATAASVALATSAIVARDVPVTATASPGPVTAGLVDRLNEVKTVKITSGGQTFTVAAKDKGWGLAERAGYPVAADKVRALALAVANLQLVEPRTSLPDRMKRLELEDPAAQGAKSKRIELLGADGKPLADLVVGKTQYGLYGGGRGGVYVRRNGEERAWLASGEIELPHEAMDLLAREVIDVPEADIAKVTLDADGPAPLVLSRADAAAKTFEVSVPPPEGRAVDPEKVDRVAGALAGLTMEDVKPAAEVAMDANARHSRFETFDGVAVDAKVVTTGTGDDAAHWAVFKAAPEATGDKAAKAAERAGAINGRVDGWAYKLSTYMADRIGAPAGIDSLLADKEGSS